MCYNLCREGKEPSNAIETGMEMFVLVIGEAGDKDFFDNNSGKGKLYHGWPTCVFKGKTIPCLIRWTPKGPITGDILVESVKTLDILGVCR